MSEALLEAGRIVNTHGIKGEVKIQPWTDSPQILAGIKTYYIDNAPVNVTSSRIHKANIIAMLERVCDVSSAMALKGKTIFILRDEIKLEDGQYFLKDLIGLDVIDDKNGNIIGKICDILNLPSNDVYVVKGDSEYMIPVVNEFIVKVSPEEGFARVKLIEGMRTDEN